MVIKEVAVCSDGTKYKNINKSQKIKKSEKQKRRLQRSISRSYEKNKKGESYCKTNNVIKKGDADKILDQLRVRRFICILTKTASVL